MAVFPAVLSGEMPLLLKADCRLVAAALAMGTAV